jgi:poly-gamma-glutamate synthesis protein (capsule biosynthesis protein)
MYNKKNCIFASYTARNREINFNMAKKITIILFGIVFLYGFGTFSVQNQVVKENGIEQDSLTTIYIIAAGDAMCHSPQFTHAKKTTGDGYDFSGCFQYLTDILAKSDLNIVNLETTLAGEPYSGYPQFCAPDAFALALKEAGFNFFLLANNHCADKGTKGTETTIEKLQDWQIPSAGTYRNEQDRQKRCPAMVEMKGIKIALLNYTYGTNGLTVNKPVSINDLNDTLQILQDLESAKKQQADVIIAFLHWGTEYQQTPNKKQKEQAQFFFKNGTDIIVGSHPHVVQPMEYFAYDQTDTAKKKLIYWSLGNFISNQRNENTDGGILASFAVTKNKNTNSVQIENQTAIPYWVYRNTSIPPGYFVLPVERFLNDTATFPFSPADRTAFQRFVENTGKIVKE